MNRMDWLKRLNPILFMAFALQALTGVAYFLAGGELLEEIHLFGGFLMIAIAIVHISLNWTWIKSTYFKKNLTNDKG